MTRCNETLRLSIFAFALALLLSNETLAQTGTVTDDAFLTSNPAMQVLNLNGAGLSLIVAGSSAAAGPVHVGASTAYIKFQLTSSLPPAIAAANVAKATLKLYIGPCLNPNGELNIYPVTSEWSESTLSLSSQPTLASTAIASNIAVGKSNSFLVIDVTELVSAVAGGIREWRNRQRRHRNRSG